MIRARSINRVVLSAGLPPPHCGKYLTDAFTVIPWESFITIAPVICGQVGRDNNEARSTTGLGQTAPSVFHL